MHKRDVISCLSGGLCRSAVRRGNIYRAKHSRGRPVVEARSVIDFQCRRSLRWRHATCGNVSGLCVDGATTRRHPANAISDRRSNDVTQRRHVPFETSQPADYNLTGRSETVKFHVAHVSLLNRKLCTSYVLSPTPYSYAKNLLVFTFTLSTTYVHLGQSTLPCLIEDTAVSDFLC